MKKAIRYSAVALSMMAVIGCTQSNKLEQPQVNTDVDHNSPITLYVAKDLITLAENTPVDSNTVAVQNGKILAVGDKHDLKTKYAQHPDVRLNTQFADKVMTPGFVEPHIHLWLSGILLGTEFITPADWQLPWGDVKGVQGADAYKQKLIDIEAKTPKGETLITWGYHQYFHGQEMSKTLLNSISEDRPIIVWHRSFHELYFNDAALQMLGWTEADWTGEGAAYDQLNWEKGHAYENGGKIILSDLLSYLIKDGFFATGMERTRDYVHSGGITTAVDPGVIVTPEMYQQMVDILLNDDFPMDYWLMPAGNFTYSMGGYNAEKGKAIAEGQTQTFEETEQIRWLPNYIKLFSDGAMYSQLMQLKDGYTDGHEGEWLQTPEELEDSMRPYWQDDYTVVIHANGDLGFESALKVVESLNKEHPRTDHRTSFHHLGITDKNDIPRAVESGVNFSVNPFYTHVLAEQYSEFGVGKERAEEMSRGRSFIDAGGVLSLHSDAPMAPAQPLYLVWAAVNRIGLSGQSVMGPQERISVDEAMRAITIDAAYTARLEDRIGTIEPGKYADFTILDSNPYTVNPKTINQIEVEATVYRGVVAEIVNSNSGMALSATNQRVMRTLAMLPSQAHHEEFCATSLLFQQAIAEASQ
ncbi:amidohydrolase [Vibrio sp. SCSIO 43132]|uniref:amidohydrolase n=1 Tax=Vibrio sp. SCSIO 43132 TaxID=2779363 RepID=UPI001CA99132|nr:amidohydrolase [Vibrio sp. SCSIO 43132]UAB73519.1 amidohydrolase [Vibrio sp. SCSIO 43132]